jgi:hypothetical protein
VIYKEQPGRKDGEEIRGTIEWYDRHALKVHRANEHTTRRDGPHVAGSMLLGNRRQRPGRLHLALC